jgi:hypothetical protein
VGAARPAAPFCPLDHPEARWLVDERQRLRGPPAHPLNHVRFVISLLSVDRLVDRPFGMVQFCMVDVTSRQGAQIVFLQPRRTQIIYFSRSHTILRKSVLLGNTRLGAGSDSMKSLSPSIRKWRLCSVPFQASFQETSNFYRCRHQAGHHIPHTREALGPNPCYQRAPSIGTVARRRPAVVSGALTFNAHDAPFCAVDNNVLCLPADGFELRPVGD